MLETIDLPGTSRRTTRLGFGGSGLMGGLSERESLRLLETAFDAGIRHFDVAPSYGHGMAERCLGKFLRSKASGDITIATKYGILPSPRAGLLSIARNMARPVVRHLPSVRKRLAQAAAGLKTKARFSAEEAQRLLEHSLQELGIDRIDLWLLHEATADDLDGSNLLPVLQQMQQEKRIGMFGIGGERSHLDALWQRHRDYCRVLQFEWSVLDAVPNFPEAFCIQHRAVSGALGTIRESFARDPALCRRWSNAIDADLASPGILAGLLLTTSLESNRNGMVLFSSRVPEHIWTNVRMVGDPAWVTRSQCFLKVLQNRGTGAH